MSFAVYEAESRGILSRTSGFIAKAGFTHSLTPARNCTFGCSYCYVPTLGIYGGLKPEDSKHWGEFTTFKSNAAELLERELRSGQAIYCSPLVDPYQPAEEHAPHMPAILAALLRTPPSVLTIQTRGPLILRDLAELRELSRRTRLRVSFSITTDRDDVRRIYEPHCASIERRFETVEALRAAGIDTFATLAPLLPCDPERLIARAIAATGCDVIGDPPHVRATKPRGATTREAAERISAKHGFEEWHNPEFQAEVVDRMRRAAAAAGRRFEIGPRGFAWLAQTSSLAQLCPPDISGPFNFR
ncbi:MAG: radical SAM protein [Acidobacteriota bacterium]|nr:radical SAM protein [Acidobacteriota bacterium]